MPQPNDLNRSLVALDQNSTVIAVIEMSQSSWLVAGVLPGIERQPRKKLEPNAEGLLGLLHRWRDEAVRAGNVTAHRGRSTLWPTAVDTAGRRRGAPRASPRRGSCRGGRASKTLRRPHGQESPAGRG